jgi:hypothetical protein
MNSATASKECDGAGKQSIRRWLGIRGACVLLIGGGVWLVSLPFVLWLLPRRLPGLLALQLLGPPIIVAGLVGAAMAACALTLCLPVRRPGLLLIVVASLVAAGPVLVFQAPRVAKCRRLKRGLARIAARAEAHRRQHGQYPEIADSELRKWSDGILHEQDFVFYFIEPPGSSVLYEMNCCSGMWHYDVAHGSWHRVRD